jgi:hypothetical protein
MPIKLGLYEKYEVITRDTGKPGDPHADYFILRLDTDVAARRAVLTYANEMELSGNVSFAEQIRARVHEWTLRDLRNEIEREEADERHNDYEGR